MNDLLFDTNYVLFHVGFTYKAAFLDTDCWLDGKLQSSFHYYLYIYDDLLSTLANNGYADQVRDFYARYYVLSL